MATATSRGGQWTGLLCVLLAAACGGGADSAADGGETADSAAGGGSASPGGVKDTIPGAGDSVPGPWAGRQDAAPVELDTMDGAGADELAAGIAPEPLRAIRIPAGTRVNVVADEDISTAEYRVGDPVIATVIHDVLGPGAGRLLPRGVRLLGRVKASMGSGGPGESPVLEIAFETLSAQSYERPVEGVVVNAPVVLDPAAARARRSASGRVAAVTTVPGLIMKGTIIGVELRAPVRVPAPAAPVQPVPGPDSVSEGDSLPRGDSVVRGDSAARPDTTPAPLWLPLAHSRVDTYLDQSGATRRWRRGNHMRARKSSKDE